MSRTPVFPAALAADGDLPIASNNAATTLSIAINATATGATVPSTTAFTAPCLITIDSEIIHVFSTSGGNTLNFGVSSANNVDGRGYDGTAAASHLANTAVQARVVARHVNQAAAEIIAIEGHTHPEFNVKAYGAKGVGVTDDYTAIAAAITAAGAHGRVFFPAATYLVSQSLKYLTGQVWTGASPSFQAVSGQSIIRAHSTFTPNTPLVTTSDNTTDINNVWLENLQFDGGSLANPIVSLYRTTWGGMRNCVVTGSYTLADGIVLDAQTIHQAYGNRFVAVKVDTIPGKAFRFINGANGNRVIDCKVINQVATTGTYGASFESLSADNLIIGGDFESFTTQPSVPPGTATGTAFNFDAAGNSVIGTRVEEVGTAFNITSNGTFTTIVSDKYTTSVTTPFAIDPLAFPFVDIRQMVPGSGNSMDYLGVWHVDTDTSSVSSAVDFSAVPQAGNSDIVYRFGRFVTTTGAITLEFCKHDGSGTITISMNLKTGDISSSGEGSFGNLVTANGAVIGASREFVVTPNYPGNGEFPAGAFISQNGTNGLSMMPGDGSSGARLVLGYFDGTIQRSAVEVANSTGFGILKLMKSGGLIQTALATIPIYANNAAAIAGGLSAGMFYRTGADPDPVCIVH